MCVTFKQVLKPNRSPRLKKKHSSYGLNYEIAKKKKKKIVTLLAKSSFKSKYTSGEPVDKCFENALAPSHIFDLRAFAPLYFNEFGSEKKSRSLSTQSERVTHLHIEIHKKKRIGYSSSIHGLKTRASKTSFFNGRLS